MWSRRIGDPIISQNNGGHMWSQITAGQSGEWGMKDPKGDNRMEDQTGGPMWSQEIGDHSSSGRPGNPSEAGGPWQAS